MARRRGLFRDVLVLHAAICLGQAKAETQRHAVLLRQAVRHRCRLIAGHLSLMRLEDEAVWTDAHLIAVVEELPAGRHTLRSHGARVVNL